MIARSPLALKLAPALHGRLAGIAKGRPLVIDYFASRLRGAMIGDLTVRFGEADAEPCYVELAALDGVTILTERHLIAILDGATIREAGPPFARHLAIALTRPDEWLEFLELRARRRH